MFEKVKIFTDGSCLGNPGPGGYGIILCYGKHKRIFSAGYHLTTNNRMELIAIIKALEKVKVNSDIVINTDSRYVKNGIVHWIYNWKNNNWKTKNNKSVKNIDLWKKLYILNNTFNLRWNWIKGHSENLENEFCDKLAKTAAYHPEFSDNGYLHSEQT